MSTLITMASRYEKCPLPMKNVPKLLSFRKNVPSILADGLQRRASAFKTRMADTQRVRADLASGFGAAQCERLRASDRRFTHPSGQSQRRKRIQHRIKSGGNVMITPEIFEKKRRIESVIRFCQALTNQTVIFALVARGGAHTAIADRSSSRTGGSGLNQSQPFGASRLVGLLRLKLL